jgi:hypothetical protein
MSLSKETEVIFDEHRGVDYDSRLGLPLLA